jgi:hypothetical protein
MLKGSLSEEEGEDVVVEIVRYEKALESGIAKRFNLVCDLGVGISVYDRDLVPLGVSIQLVVRVIRRRSVPRIDNARVLHQEIRRRLIVDVVSHRFKA